LRGRRRGKSQRKRGGDEAAAVERHLLPPPNMLGARNLFEPGDIFKRLVDASRARRNVVDAVSAVREMAQAPTCAPASELSA
jgi:hypothetical protein